MRRIPVAGLRPDSARHAANGYAQAAHQGHLFWLRARPMFYCMNSTSPATTALQRLRAAGLRPTRQRLALAQLLLGTDHRHVTAEQLHGEALSANIRVSLATVYNTLHQFTEAGLLREAVVEPGRSYFDTNTAEHHHFFCEATGALHDIPATQLALSGLPLPPSGTKIRRVDIIVRIGPGDHKL